MNQSEKSLLQQYVRTLQKQNQSRHKQNMALTETVDRLIAENQQLRSNKSNVAARIVLDHRQQQKTKKLAYQLNQLKTAYQLLVQQQSRNPEVFKLRQELKRKEQENIILIQYKQKITKQLRELQASKSTISSSQSIKLRQYQKQISVYQTKITQYEIKLSLLSQQIAFQTGQYTKISQKYKTEVNQFNFKIKQLESRNRTSQNTITSSQKLIFQSRIKQISAQYDELKNMKASIQRQKQQLQIRVGDLSTQIAQKNNIISQLRSKDQYSRSNQSVLIIKQRQLQSVNTLVRNLRTELQQNQYTLTQKESVIRSLQSKISLSSSSSTNDVATMKRLVQDKNNQINRLIESHNRNVQSLNIQIQKYKSINMANSYNTQQFHVLKEENQFLRRQNQNNLQIISQLRNQKQTIKQANEHYIRRLNQLQETTKINASSISKHQFTQNSRILNHQQTELRSIVLGLKKQLDDVRLNNSKVHQENINMQRYLLELSEINSGRSPNFGNGQISRLYSPQNINKLYSNNPSSLQLNFQQEYAQKNVSKHYHNQPYFKSEYNLAMKKKEQKIVDRHVSPVRDSRNANGNNKQKWQNLQRKISALRVENDELKRTLLYD